MTGTERGALIVLVVAAAAGLLGYRMTREDAPDPVAETARVGESIQPPSGPHARPLSHAPPSGGSARPGAGDRRVPPPVGGDRRAASGSASEEAIGVRPEPRRALQGASGGVTRPDPEAEADAAHDVAVGQPNGGAREVVPPKTNRQAGGGAAEAPPVVEEVAPKPDDPAHEVLLSIPLRGAVEPEQGAGPPPETSGLVTNGGQVEFTEDAQYTLPVGGNVNSGAGTISFTVEPNWAGSDDSNNSLLQIRDEHVWENSLGIVKNYNSLRYVIHDEQGLETNVNVYIDDWQPNERHIVTATWDEEQMTLSVDGAEVGASPLANPVRFRDAMPMHVGSDFPGSTYRGANARISDLTVRSTSLAPAGVP